jgi:hypothetical protein
MDTNYTNIVDSILKAALVLGKPMTANGSEPFVALPNECHLEGIEQFLPHPTKKAGAPKFSEALLPTSTSSNWRTPSFSDR